jgi:uncharacterized protein (TIGR02452 family)
MDRKTLAQETLEIIDKEIFTHPTYGPVVLAGIANTVCITNPSPLPPQPLRPPQSIRPSPTIITVVKKDTFATAWDLRKTHDRVCVLNFASGTTPGGGFKSGAQAQEEQLCYRSTLYKSLTVGSSKWKYPLPIVGGVFSPDVLVFRGQGPNYPVWDWPKCFMVDVVSAAAICHPHLTSSATYQPTDRELMVAKIRAIPRIPATRGCDALVLGAFGCGVFGNPPDQVAGCFKHVLSEPEFTRAYKTVCFGVIDPRNEGNYDVFNQVLCSGTL